MGNRLSFAGFAASANEQGHAAIRKEAPARAVVFMIILDYQSLTV
jgi:hypothetical protein